MSGIAVDTSALAAIFKADPRADRLAENMSSASSVVIPASCLVEAALLSQVGRGFFTWVEERLEDPRFQLGEITRPAALLAAHAARTYGKGSGHPAQLNFGDCFSYAVAKHADLPLLFVGEDFAHTDITPALKTE